MSLLPKPHLQLAAYSCLLLEIWVTLPNQFVAIEKNGMFCRVLILVSLHTQARVHVPVLKFRRHVVQYRDDGQ